MFLKVIIDETFYTPEVTRLIRDKNARVWINALDHADVDIRAGKIENALNKLTLYNANIVQTDEPERILEYLRSKKLHN